MEEKFFVVVIDGVPTFNLSIEKLKTVKSIKDFLYSKYPNHTIKMYINLQTLLKTFDTDKYDDMNFESVWDKIEDGKIELSSQDLVSPLDLNFKETKITKTQCIKVSELRKVYGKDINLRKWLEDPQNVYVGRHGRIFIDGEIFHYPDSKWGNPFKTADYTLEESLSLYRAHLSEAGLLTLENLSELKGKTLGCFCITASTTPVHKLDCHTKVLYDEIQKL